MEITSNLWPCLGEAGLRVFATTADQRYQAGEDLFLATHFPVTLRRFRAECPSDVLAETALLERLLKTSDAHRGNRVFVLYGAAGSGKSELMKWLQVMIERHEPGRAQLTIRIPRTELNVMAIAQRFQNLLSGSYFNETTRKRWEEARKKPRTLSKLLLLTALERCLDGDEQINALYYRLLDWIHPHIVRSLDAMGSTEPETDELVRLFTREDLEELKAETSLHVPLNYEQFRHHLVTAFREHLMEGQHLPDTLGRIAEDLKKRGTRPILLVDDLVQSLNLFATDLLDYFITLGSGNWDVVLGLTPAALATDRRGQELLNRITYLDTVDDRVEKLWLSDIQGADSYFLTEETCSAFATRYLETYRELNGWSCQVCPEQHRCAGLNSSGEAPLLAPFNEVLLQRLFRGLPEGKGKVRYFLRHLRDVLAAASDDDGFLTMLKRYADLDTAVEADDETVAEVAELYGPLPSNHRVKLPADLMVAFGEPAKSVSLPAELLKHRRTSSESPSSVRPLTDPGRVAIKAWLDGEPVSRQSLLQLRKGIARWVRMVQPVRPLHAIGVARPHKVLRWRAVYLGVRPPILLESVDQGEGIWVTKEIGLVAFRLYDFAEVTGKDRKALLASLAREIRLVPLLHAAADYHQRVRSELEKQLGMPVEELAVALYTWLAIAQGVPREPPPGFDEDFWEQVVARRAHLAIWRSEPGKTLVQSVRYLFDDFFQLRKNIFSGPQILSLTRDQTPEALLDALMSIEVEQLDRNYHLNEKPLNRLLSVVQETIQTWHTPDEKLNDLSPAAQTVLLALTEDRVPGVLLHQVPSEMLAEIRRARPALYRRLRITSQSLHERSHNQAHS